MQQSASPGEFLDAVQEAGFEVLGQETREEFTPNYLADFLPRLRNHGHPRYRDLPIDLLQPSQIRILLQKLIGRRKICQTTFQAA